MKVRVKFSKYGNMKFIGHLDVMRYFQKAIRRAGIDIAYTEGLSPHMIMSFASPLGVGLTSDAEYMDIELHTPIASREAIAALNRVGVEGIEVTGFYEIPDGKANKAMTLVAAADYTVRFREGFEPDKLMCGKQADETGTLRTDPMSLIDAFYAQEKIIVWKKTKKSEKEVDIRPLIYEMRWISDDQAAEASPFVSGAVFLKLASGSVANLKPELVMDAFLEKNGIEPRPFAYEINRCELYADLGKEDRSLVPLKDLGVEIL